MNNKITLISSIILALALTFLACAYYTKGEAQSQNIGATVRGNESHATSTSPVYGFTSGQKILADTGPGSLESYIVTVAGTAGGNIECFDATTTNPTKRASSMSSTTQLLASFPSNLAAGSYPIGAQYVYGLACVIAPGTTVGTSTILWR